MLWVCFLFLKSIILALSRQRAGIVLVLVMAEARPILLLFPLNGCGKSYTPHWLGPTGRRTPLFLLHRRGSQPTNIDGEEAKILGETLPTTGTTQLVVALPAETSILGL
jgi:hypothetical protein